MYVNIVNKHLHITCAYYGMKYDEILLFTMAYLHIQECLYFLQLHLQSGVQSKFAFPHNGNNHLCSCNQIIVGKQMTVQE